MIQLWKLRLSIISREDTLFLNNWLKITIKTSSLHRINNLSFEGCITNLISYILLSGDTAKSLLENLKKKYSKEKSDLKNAGQVLHYRTPKGPKKHRHHPYFCHGYTTSPNSTSLNQILKIVYLTMIYQEMQTKAILMIVTPLAMQRHLTNHEKKDLYQQKRKKHKHIPD